MFDKIVSIYKEVKQAMDKRFEVCVEAGKEICIEAMNKKAEATDKKIELCKDVYKEIKSIMSNPQNKRAVAVAIAGIGVTIGTALAISSFGPVAA